MKKVICFLLIITLFTATFGMLVFAKSNVSPNIVANYQFTSGTAGWAKHFLTEGVSVVNVSWSTGQRCDSGATLS